MRGRRLRLGVFTSCTAATAGALTAAPAVTTSSTAEAQPGHDAADADVRPSSTCTFTVPGVHASSGPCSARVIHRAGTDAAAGADMLYIEAESAELRTVSVHGELEIELPPSNVNTPLTLRVSF